MHSARWVLSTRPGRSVHSTHPTIQSHAIWDSTHHNRSILSDVYQHPFVWNSGAGLAQSTTVAASHVTLYVRVSIFDPVTCPALLVLHSSKSLRRRSKCPSSCWDERRTWWHPVVGRHLEVVFVNGGISWLLAFHSPCPYSVLGLATRSGENSYWISRLQTLV